MKLSADWKKIVKKAWSVRLLVIAGLLSGVEIILPLLVDSFPKGVFAALSFVFTAAAFIARIVAQNGFEDGRQ